MSLLTAPKGTRPGAVIRSRTEALHLAGHTIGLMAHGRHFIQVAGATDLCSLDSAALCPEGEEVTDFEAAVIMAAGWCAEAHDAHLSEQGPIGDDAANVISLPARSERWQRSVINVEDLAVAADLSKNCGSDLLEVIESAVYLVTANWRTATLFADRFESSTGPHIMWDDICDLADSIVV